MPLDLTPPADAALVRIDRMGTRERLACALLAARYDYPIKPEAWRYWPGGDIVVVDFPGAGALFGKVRLESEAARAELKSLGALERAEEAMR